MAKRKNKKKQKKQRVFYLLLLLLITSLSLTTSTYAWFTTNRMVQIDLLDVSVRAQGGIEVSVDGTSWKSKILLDDLKNASEKYGTNINQIPFVLEPVSTIGELEDGKMKMFKGTAMNNSSGKYTLEATRSNEEQSFGEESNGIFITFDLFLKTNTNTNLYLTPASNAKYLGEKSVGIENAVRFAFIEEGTTTVNASLNTIQNLKTNDNSKVYIWEPNYDTHTEHGIANARDIYGLNISNPSNPISYDGVSKEISKNMNITTDKASANNYPNYFKKVDAKYYTKNGFDANTEIFNLRAGITKIRVYMWVEGQDVDCENNASIGNMSLNLQFSTNPS